MLGSILDKVLKEWFNKEKLELLNKVSFDKIYWCLLILSLQLSLILPFISFSINFDFNDNASLNKFAHDN